MFADALVTDPAGRAVTYRRAVRPSLGHVRWSHLNTFSCATFFRRRIFEQGHLLDPRWKSIGDAIWVHGMLKARLRLAIYPHLLSVFTLTGANLSTDSSVSDREKQTWQAGFEKPPALQRKLYVLAHRLQKLAAGAYRRRTFDYEIFTLPSPAKRVRFSARAVGGTWKVT